MFGARPQDCSSRFVPRASRFGFGLLAMVCSLILSTGARAQVRPTESGAVKGVTIDNVAEFRGIPYAAPPVGGLRWRPPAAPIAWTGTRDASQYGPACEQQLAFYPLSEDCLTLNIFAPASATASSNLPVMVWIHGGGFMSGSGRDFDASALVTRGNIVVVTLNYRLGYFGFLAHPALSAADPITCRAIMGCWISRQPSPGPAQHRGLWWKPQSPHDFSANRRAGRA